MRSLNVYQETEEGGIAPAGAPSGYLDQDERAILIHLRVHGGGPTDPDELHDLFSRNPRYPLSARRLKELFRELTVGGYLQRVSQNPETYQMTPAGCDAAEAYAERLAHDGADE